MLAEEEYEDGMVKCIKEVERMSFKNKRSKWEFCKYKIRQFAIEYGKKRAKERRKEKKKAEEDYAKALEERTDEEEIDRLRINLKRNS